MAIGCAFFCVFVPFLIFAPVSLAQQESFYSAVVEYGVINNASSETSVLENLLRYEDIVAQILQKNNQVQIIVFPEGGLQTVRSEDPALLFAEIVPEGNASIIPCNYNDTKALKRLSCLAKKFNVYLVVNLIEKYVVNASTNSSNFYNTNVVFNKTGGVVARYRKFHIWGQDGRPLTKPKTADLTYFDTDFGVRFGTFTCFDIIFKTPGLDLINNYGVKHFVFPTGWFSEMPFLTAIQEQASWARGNNVALLAANTNGPDVGHTGSGIYVGNKVVKAAQITQKHDFAIIAKVPKVLTGDWVDETATYLALNTSKELNNTSYFRLKSDKHISLINSELVADGPNFTRWGDNIYSEFFRISKTSVTNKTICQRDLCCSFSFTYIQLYKDNLLNISSLSDLPVVFSDGEGIENLRQFKAGSNSNLRGDAFGRYEYRLAVFDGVRSYDGIDTGGIQFCALLSCNDQSTESCARPTYNVQPLSRSFDGRTFSKFITGFENIFIAANFNTNNTLISPNVLVHDFSHDPSDTTAFGTVDDHFTNYTFYKMRMDSENKTTRAAIVSESAIRDIGVFGLYTRLFDRDGQPATAGAATFYYTITLSFITIMTCVFTF